METKQGWRILRATIEDNFRHEARRYIIYCHTAIKISCILV